MENECKDNCSCYSNLRIYEDFVPTSELVHGKDYNTLLLNLPGFKKEEIKIQLSKTGLLKISGQKPVNKLLSFQKDILVSTNCDKRKINAKLSNGILYVTHPKHIIPSQKNEIENENENELPYSSTKNEPKQDNKKEQLDGELNKHGNAKQEQPKSHRQKQEQPKSNVQTQEQPKSPEQKQVVTGDKSMKDATTQSSSGMIAKLKGLIAKLKVSSKVMTIALATLVVLGVGGYVVKEMMSSKKAKE